MSLSVSLLKFIFLLSTRRVIHFNSVDWQPSPLEYGSLSLRQEFALQIPGGGRGWKGRHQGEVSDEVISHAIFKGVPQTQ